MEKEKALKVMDTIDVCVVPLSIAGGARFGLNTYDIYRKVVGTKFRLSEALVCGLICMPLGMYAANVYADYISKPIRKAIENRASKEEPEKKDDISAAKKAKDIVKEKTEEFKKDLNALVADIAVEPEEEEIGDSEISTRYRLYLSKKSGVLLSRAYEKGSKEDVAIATALTEYLLRSDNLTWDNVAQYIRDHHIDVLEERYFEKLEEPSLATEVGKAVNLLDRVRKHGGRKEEIAKAEEFLYFLKEKYVLYKEELNILNADYGIGELEEKYGKMD